MAAFKTKKQKNIMNRLISYIILIPTSLVAMVPFLWMVISAFKSEDELFTIPPKILPSALHFENFSYVFKMDMMGNWIFNTVFVCVSTITLMAISSVIVAYGFARFDVKPSNFFFMLLLATMMLPWAITMIPAFVMFSKVGWVGTWLPLIIPSIGGSPVYIFMIRQYIMTIPRELDEAAMIDGASSFKILWNIIVPNCKPIMMTMIIFAFSGAWGDFLGPFIYLSDPMTFTLSLGINTMRTVTGYIPWHYMMAASAMFAIPVVFIYFFGMKFFTKGLVMSGLKG